MLSVPWVVSWFAFIAIMLWLFQRLTKWSTELNIFTLFLVFLILRHGISVPFDHTVNQWYAGIDVSDEAFKRYYISLIIMWTCIYLGAACGYFIFGSIAIDATKFYREMKVGALPTGINLIFPVLLGAIIGVVVAFNLRFEVNISDLLTGHLTAEQYKAMRDSFGVETLYTTGLGNRLASIARFGLFPTVVCVTYYLAKRSWLWKLVFLGTLGTGLLIGVISGQKGAAVFLLVALGIAAFYKTGSSKITLFDRRLWFLGAFCVVLVSLLYNVQYPGESFLWAIKATIFRLTSEADRGLQLYFQVYPDVHPFLGGRSSGLVSALLGSPLPIEELPERFIPIHYIGPTYMNTWNAAFIGVAWADFGYLGVIFESLFVGLLLYWYARWFSRIRKTALVVGTQVGLIMAATRISEVALSANLLTFGLLSSFILYLLSRVRRHSEETVEVK
jgi:oligosaccharide repeat unit polymerase